MASPAFLKDESGFFTSPSPGFLLVRVFSESGPGLEVCQCILDGWSTIATVRRRVHRNLNGSAGCVGRLTDCSTVRVTITELTIESLSGLLLSAIQYATLTKPRLAVVLMVNLHFLRRGFCKASDRGIPSSVS